MTECKCPVAGYCERHKVNKSEHWHMLCQTRPDYFLIWEDGKGPGQPQPIIGKKVKPMGVGTIIHEHLAKIGITVTEGCSCTSHMNTLNAWGPRVCRDNIETIIDWMQEEAKKRSLPFCRVVAKSFIRWCIRKAEKLSVSN